VPRRRSGVEVCDDACPLARLREDDPRARFQRAGHGGWLSPVRLAFTSDDGNVDGPSSGLDDRADQHVARDIGQPEIANDHVEVTTAEDPQRFLSATGCGDVGALDPEQGTSTNRGRGGTIDSNGVEALRRSDSGIIVDVRRRIMLVSLVDPPRKERRHPEYATDRPLGRAAR